VPIIVIVMVINGPSLGLPYLGLDLAFLIFLVAFTGWFVISYKSMPFRIYNAGITKPFVPLSNGLRGEEVLIPFEQVKTLGIQTNLVDADQQRSLRLTYEQSPGRTEAIVFSGYSEDLMPIIDAIYQTAPSKIDSTLNDYVGPGAERKIISIPNNGPADVRGGSGQYYFLLGSAIAINLVWCLVLVSGSSSLGVFLYAWALGGGFGSLIILSGYIRFSNSAKATIEMCGRIEGDRLVCPVPLVYRLFGNVRPYIPVEEITEVRKSVDPRTLGHMADVRTTGGEELRLRYNVFASLMGTPGFERSGWILRNLNADVGRPGSLVVRRSPFKAMSVAIAIIAMQPLTVLLHDAFSFSLPEVDLSAPMPFFLIILVAMGVFFSMVGWMGYLVYKKDQLDSMADGFRVTSEEISTPWAEAGFQKIPREQVESLTTVILRYSNAIRLKTPNGYVDLPLTVAEALRRADYQIIDESRVLQSVTEEPSA